MNLKVLLLALLSLMLGFSACNNEDDDVYKPIIPVPMIKTITTVDKEGDTHIFSFEYDDLGRISKRNYNDQPYEKYNYESDSLILVELFYDNFTEIDTLRLNDQGLVVSNVGRKLHHVYDDDEMYYFAYGIRQYDANGHLIYIRSNYGGTNEAFKIMDGNTVESSFRYPYRDGVTTGDSIIVSTYNYEFFTTTTNTIGNENKGMPFFGKQNKNLSKVYTYRYDSQRRVIMKSFVSDKVDWNYHRTYTYY